MIMIVLIDVINKVFSHLWSGGQACLLLGLNQTVLCFLGTIQALINQSDLVIKMAHWKIK